MTAMRQAISFVRHAGTPISKPSRPAGDISSVFPSLSGKVSESLPPRFRVLKERIVQGMEKDINDSWSRLLESLKIEAKKINALGSEVRKYVS